MYCGIPFNKLFKSSMVCNFVLNHHVGGRLGFRPCKSNSGGTNHDTRYYGK